MGYGTVLIEFSYALSMIEKIPGTPERPLSDLGHLTYVKCWSRKIIGVLLELEKTNQQEISIQTIIDKTGIIYDDIFYVLQGHDIID